MYLFTRADDVVPGVPVDLGDVPSVHLSIVGRLHQPANPAAPQTEATTLRPGSSRALPHRGRGGTAGVPTTAPRSLREAFPPRARPVHRHPRTRGCTTTRPRRDP